MTKQLVPIKGYSIYENQEGEQRVFSDDATLEDDVVTSAPMVNYQTEDGIKFDVFAGTSMSSADARAEAMRKALQAAQETRNQEVAYELQNRNCSYNYIYTSAMDIADKSGDKELLKQMLGFYLECSSKEGHFSDFASMNERYPQFVNEDTCNIQEIYDQAMEQGKSYGAERVAKTFNLGKEKIGRAIKGYVESQLEKFHNSNETTIAEYREEMTKKLLTHEFIRMVIRPKVNVNDDDITAAILKNGGTKFLEYIQFHVKHIFLKNGLQAAQKMDKIYQELKSGVSFETLVKKFSEDSHTKDKGGDLGLIAKDDISSQLRKELIKLKPGLFSKPIATSTGIHILKLIKFVSKKHPEMARLRQKWEAQLTEQAIRTQLNVWVQNRRGASTIKYLN